MQQRDLVELIKEHTGCTRLQATHTYKALFAAITDAAVTDKSIRVKDFGTFLLANRAGHVGRNPRTGEEMKLPPTSILRFRASQTLKQKLNPPDAAAKPTKTAPKANRKAAHRAA